jgi:hypothetical protein
MRHARSRPHAALSERGAGKKDEKESKGFHQRTTRQFRVIAADGVIEALVLLQTLKLALLADGYTMIVNIPLTVGA